MDTVISPNRPSRQGSALVTATVILILLSSIALVLTNTTVSSLQQENRRTRDLKLTMAAESAANIAYDYLGKQGTALLMPHDTFEVKKGQSWYNPNQLDSGFATVSSDELGIKDINGMPITVKWCYLGQRAARQGADALGSWVVELYTGTDWNMGDPPTAAMKTGGYEIQDVYLVRGQAEYGSAADPNEWRKLTVDMLFAPISTTFAVRALFADLGYTFMGSADTDSWDSSDGTTAYAIGISGDNGDIGSNGSISVAKPGNVNGVAEGNLNLKMPEVDYSLAPGSYSGYTIGSPNYGIDASTTLTGPGSYRVRYVDLDSRQGDLLTIDGNVTLYVDGPLQMYQKNTDGGVLKYTDLSSRLTVIQNDYDPDDYPGMESVMDLNGNDGLGNVTNPQQFILMSDFTGDLKFNGNGNFGGVFIAPNATVKLNGTFDMYGSIVAHAFGDDANGAGKVNGNFAVHYDDSLADLILPLPPTYTVIGWYAHAMTWGGK